MAPMTATAIRHPKRGKAHRVLRDIHATALMRDEATGKFYSDASTVCRRLARHLTQRVPLDTVPTDQRCKRCWPEEVGT